ncbi:MAG: type II toxin-antitoxin system prevent-host-death family antitoxin [Spirochaetes bacterium]|nr:type II toxin-antitoxin system prevent-host-death family antitoxin [Spirochaetota bacterium]
MQVSTKELRKEPGKVLQQVVRGVPVVVSYRGKKMAKLVRIVPAEKPDAVDGKDEIFGLWKNYKNKESVEAMVRRLRQGRSFAHR